VVKPATLAQKRRRLSIERGVPLKVSTERANRKIGALMAMGWSMRQCAAAVGSEESSFRQILARETMYRRSAHWFDDAYRILEMRVPEDTMWTRRTKSAALLAGHHPPLAWEDIDAGILADVEADTIPRDRLDQWTITELLADPTRAIRSSPAEKVEVLRRWVRMGYSEKALCDLTGWKPGRYTT
jgi:hypothetical protein